MVALNDRVRVTTRNFGEVQHGQVGTVISLDSGFKNLPIRVKFDDPQPNGRKLACAVNIYRAKHLERIEPAASALAPGARVRVKTDRYEGKAASAGLGVIEVEAGPVWRVRLDDGQNLVYFADELTLSDEPVPAPITLVEGRSYRTASGLCTGPMRVYDDDWFDVADDIPILGDILWNEDGTTHYEDAAEHRIVAEWTGNIPVPGIVVAADPEPEPAPPFGPGDLIRSVSDESDGIAPGDAFTVTALSESGAGWLVDFVDRSGTERTRFAARYARAHEEALS